MKTIEKEAGIPASKEQAWGVLPGDTSSRIRYTAFCKGVQAVSDWNAGSKAAVADGKGNGLTAKTTEHLRPK